MTRNAHSNERFDFIARTQGLTLLAANDRVWNCDFHQPRIALDASKSVFNRSSTQLKMRGEPINFPTLNPT
jgi:hypothetical protein